MSQTISDLRKNHNLFKDVDKTPKRLGKNWNLELVKELSTYGVELPTNKEDLRKIQEDLKEEFNAIIEGENLDPVTSDQESAANGININKNLGVE